MASGQNPQDDICQEKDETGNLKNHNDLKRSLPERTEDRKLKSQLNAGPASADHSTPDSTVNVENDPWEQKSSIVEQELSQAILQLDSMPVQDRVELKKRVAELHKSAHDLMTHYNQRINDLLMADRLSHRHASETSAHMIRGVMPHLEALRLLGKSLISTKKNAEEESIQSFINNARSELIKASQLLKEIKQKLNRNTLPLKPNNSVAISPLKHLLENEPRPQKKALENTDSNSHNRLPTASSGKSYKNSSKVIRQNKSNEARKNKSIKTDKSLPNKTSNQSNTKTNSDDPYLDHVSSNWLSTLKIPELKSLATPLKLDNNIEAMKNGQATLAALGDYILSKWQLYNPITPMFSMACNKCELLGMNQDKVCKNGLDSLDTLKEIELLLVEKKLGNIAEDGLYTIINALKKADIAITKLSIFDKKMPGEAKQLLTELLPANAAPYHHLLNLITRKLLLDGPGTLSLKTNLWRFEAIDQYFHALLSEPETVNHNQHLITIFTEKKHHSFSSSVQFRKIVEPINKLEEVHALVYLFAHWDGRQNTLLLQTLDKLEQIPVDKQLENIKPIIEKGQKAHDYLTHYLLEKISPLLKEKRSEKALLVDTFKQQLIDYFEQYEQAVKSAMSHDNEINCLANVQDENIDLIKQLAEIIKSIEASASVSNASMPLSRGLCAWIDHGQPLATITDHLRECQSFLINGIKKEQIEIQIAITALTTLLKLQQLAENQDYAIFTEPATHNQLTPLPAIEEAFKALDNKRWQKWCDQLFHRSRLGTITAIRCLISVCQQSTIAYRQAAELLSSVSQELCDHNDDPLIQQLLTAVEGYIKQIKG